MKILEVLKLVVKWCLAVIVMCLFFVEICFFQSIIKIFSFKIFVISLGLFFLVTFFTFYKIESKEFYKNKYDEETEEM